jgi:hypothetical protein
MIAPDLFAALAHLAEEVGRRLEHGQTGDALVAVTKKCGSFRPAEYLQILDIAAVIDLEPHVGARLRQLDWLET